MLKDLKLKDIKEQINICNSILSEMEKPSISKLEQLAGEGKDSIRKRFKKNGYSYNKQSFKFEFINDPVDAGTKKITKDKKQMEEKIKVNLDNFEIEQLKELINMIEPLKDMLENGREGTEKGENSLRVLPISEVQTKVFKIDKKVLKRWDKFTKTHKEYKIQQLITQALIEFMDNHG